MSVAAAPPVESSLSRGRFVGRRVVAAALDLLLIPNLLLLIGQAVGGDVGSALAWFVAIAAVAIGQGRQGASFGMAIVGLVVVSERPGPPGIARSVLRHGWIVLGFVVSALLVLVSMAFDGGLGSAAFLVIGAVGTGASLAVPLAVLLSIGTGDDGRGLHDRWSGLAVRPTVVPDHRAKVIALLVVVWVLLRVAVPLVAEPEPVHTDRIGDATTTSATCDVASRLLTGAQRDERIQLSRGMDVVEFRHGPHLVRFDDQPFPRDRAFGGRDAGGPGLYYEVRAAGYRGLTSSSGAIGTQGIISEVEIRTLNGGGLDIRCTAPNGTESEDPSPTVSRDEPAIINPTAAPPSG